jgi:hypothetical protein
LRFCGSCRLQRTTGHYGYVSTCAFCTLGEDWEFARGWHEKGRAIADAAFGFSGLLRLAAAILAGAGITAAAALGAAAGAGWRILLDRLDHRHSPFARALIRIA